MEQLHHKNTWDKQEKKNRKRGAVVAFSIHGILLLLFILFGLSSAYPPPLEGIMVNFGTTDTGSEPTPAEAIKEIEEAATPPQPVEEVVEQVTEPVVEEVQTQEVVEAPAVKEPEKKKPVEEVKKPVEKKPEEKKEPVKEPVKEKPVEEVKPPEEVKPKVDEKSLFKGFPSDKNNPSNEGKTGQPGDQGIKTGDPSSKNYEGTESYGKGNSGIGYDLAGRGLKSIPEISDKSQETGTVAVRIKVDRQGNVIEATYTTKGSTTTNSQLIKLAEEAARKAKFTPNSNAPEEQFGSITFTFRLK